MINFLKKYWLNISIGCLLTVLIFFFIPNEENRYLESEIGLIKKKSHLVLLWTEIILFGSIFILVLIKTKKISELFFSIFGILLLALTFFFIFDSIFLSSAFFLNKLTTSKIVDKKYTVTYLDKDKKYLMLYDNTIQESITADKLLLTNDHLEINMRDTITISFKKGLLDFNFDPRIVFNKK